MIRETFQRLSEKAERAAAAFEVLARVLGRQTPRKRPSALAQRWHEYVRWGTPQRRRVSKLGRRMIRRRLARGQEVEL